VPIHSDDKDGSHVPTWLITGCSTGLGRSLAEAVLARGDNAIITARDATTLADLTQSHPGTALALSLDVTDDAQITRAVQQGEERFGAIDVLVNNAGGQFTAPAEEISDNGWRAVHRLAVDAAWSVTRTVATRSMIPRRGGLVVFIGFSPQRGNPGFAHACAARAAVANLASGLAMEWARHGIRSVCLAVGTILTEGLEQYGEAEAERWRRAIPLGRLGTPAEVAGVIAFLATPAGAYITATTIAVDGGADAWGMGEPVPE
jgi:citronellol/citronellal dehydrogenase